MTPAREPVLLKAEHAPGCYAISERWWIAKCNCTFCPATIAVNESWILDRLPHGVAADA